MLRWCRSTSVSKQSRRPASVPATSDSSSTPLALACARACRRSGGLLGGVVLVAVVLLVALVMLLVLLLVRSMMRVMLVMRGGHHRLDHGARQHQRGQGSSEQVANPHGERSPFLPRRRPGPAEG